jgi:hypothetical protein
VPGEIPENDVRIAQDSANAVLIAGVWRYPVKQGCLQNGEQIGKHERGQNRKTTPRAGGDVIVHTILLKRRPASTTGSQEPWFSNRKLPRETPPGNRRGERQGMPP